MPRYICASGGPLIGDPSACDASGPHNSGGGGIRTHGGLATTTVFETVRFVHSRTPPTISTW